MKKFILMSAAVAAMILTSCSNELDGETPNGSDTGVAYVSVKVDAEPRSRDSGEDQGTSEESKTKSLYLITFNANGGVVPVPGSSLFYTEIQTTSITPDAVKVSAASKNLMVIANPGAKLKDAITGLTSSSTFTTFNAALSGLTTADIVANDGSLAMITSGDETGKVVDDKIIVPYVTIGNKIYVVTGTGTEEAAKSEAEKPENRLEVKLERFAAKLVVKVSTSLIPDKEANFKLTDWTVDAVNSTYYPFAEKTLISVAHTGTSYTNNFYTKDPNYTNHTGIVYGVVNETTYMPELPWTDTTYPNGYYGWKKPETGTAYVIENTMAANSQTIANATRIVIKATYSPKDFPENTDWFSWQGVNYKTLADLQNAYKDVNATTAMKEACDKFYAKIKAYKNDIIGTDFATLTTGDLAAITPGGQVVKDGKNPIIFWYKGGVCYYYYEIRHDNSTNAGTMAFAKYGVVRNNWYNLTLNTVKGPGTPWYPEVEKPGPGDPDPEKPIDDKEGYLGIGVKINPWVIFETGFGI